MNPLRIPVTSASPYGDFRYFLVLSRPGVLQDDRLCVSRRRRDRHALAILTLAVAKCKHRTVPSQSLIRTKSALPSAGVTKAAGARESGCRSSANQVLRRPAHIGHENRHSDRRRALNVGGEPHGLVVISAAKLGGAGTRAISLNDRGLAAGVFAHTSKSDLPTHAWCARRGRGRHRCCEANRE